MLEFREITKDNLYDVASLTLLPHQVGYTPAGNWKIIAESNYHDDAWIRGIYVNQQPVGLVMLSLWEPEEWYAIWKLMIDQKHQKQGHGRTVIAMAIEAIKDLHPKANLVRLTCRKPEQEGSPYEFYKKLGFEPNGEEVDGDLVLLRSI